MRRTLSISRTEAAEARAIAFDMIAYARQLRQFATTGAKRRMMDAKEALRLAGSMDASARRCGMRLP